MIKSLQILAMTTKRCFSSQSVTAGISASYMEDMYDAWLKDPASVHSSWDLYFRNSANKSTQYKAQPVANTVPHPNVTHTSFPSFINVTPIEPVAGTPVDKTISEHLAVHGIIRGYQMRGHLVAQLDPLNIKYAALRPGEKQPDYLFPKLFVDRKGIPSEAVVRQYMSEFNESFMDKVFKIPKYTYIGGKETHLPLREIIKRLENIYCRHIGAEYRHITSMEQADFICKRMETPGIMNIDKATKRLFLMRLARTHGLEAFLAKKWSSEKRFGLEGCDVMIPAMQQIIDKSTNYEVDSFTIGMAHRGRLNVLVNVCKKPLVQLFTQFHALEAVDEGSGDVKYHLGTFVKRVNRETNKNIKITIVANPSHLESTSSLTLGKVKAEQFYRGDTEGKKCLPFLLHGDAAFAGQGIVLETLNLATLPEYTTHGTIHIVANNQIGFTTDPRFSRSCPYCTDCAKGFDIPILHVNADEPESVMHVCNIAAEWRATFHKDIVIDIVGYRRNGHNEIDEPMFTQPLMYQLIRKTPPIFEKYSKKLLQEGIITEEELKKEISDYEKMCNDAYEAAKKETHIKLTDWLDSPWDGFFSGKDKTKIKPTGVKEEILTHIGKIHSSPPPPDTKFVLHRGIDRILKLRMEMVNNKEVDWSLGEAMAFGTLVKEGIHVRLSGQDVERGTFSHRHHVLHHQTVDKQEYRPLCTLYPDQAPYKVCNSSLSEYAVSGFEVGFAIQNPNALVMWEAQFGDFANTAQTITDTVVSAGESKWVRQCGVVFSMPHGLEGMGPEHSSARMERYLQNSSEDPDHFPPEPEATFAVKQLHECNWIVACCTTPGNFFHLIRRQIAMPFRKPLIHLAPKSLLRHPDAKSKFSEMTEGTEFRRVIPEDGPASKSPDQVKKLIFCCGKVYYDMKNEREAKKLTNVLAISRIEQMSPFPFDLVKKECAKYPNAQLCWAQEEHKNQGGWSYVEPRFKTAINKTRNISYAGRIVSPSPATGVKVQYTKENEQLLIDTMKI